MTEPEPDTPWRAALRGGFVVVPRRKERYPLMRIVLSYEDGSTYSTRDLNAVESDQLRRLGEELLQRHDVLPVVEGVFADVSTLVTIEERERLDPAGEA